MAPQEKAPASTLVAVTGLAQAGDG
jgi:hypothetical protein